jgi:hypothetical protein
MSVVNSVSPQVCHSEPEAKNLVLAQGDTGLSERDLGCAQDDENQIHSDAVLVLGQGQSGN